MKVAYIFVSQKHTISYVLDKMIIPQIQEDRHGADVIGMFFFEDNVYALLKGNPLADRLQRLSEAKDILLMGCDQCCFERDVADKLIQGAKIGCFPDLYAALADNMPDQVISL